MTLSRQDLGALCGIVGPVAFVSAWLLGGALTEGYDPLSDAISQLAREGADTQLLMTTGFVVFGVLLPVWASTLGHVLSSRALRVSVSVAGLATLGVALFPLSRAGGQPQDVAHALMAVTGYAATAVSPLLGAAALGRRRLTTVARASITVGVVSAVALVGSVVTGSGGLQRLGLTVVDGWYVVLAVAVLRRRL